MTRTLPTPRTAVDPRSPLAGRVTAVYARISDDQFDTAAGVGRQTADGRTRGAALGATEMIDYTENDTSAYKRRKVTITDEYGDRRQAWRVMRPRWAEMMRAIRAGEIQAVIVYDLDRLCRDPRDLEDAIETAEYHGVRWEDITGGIDLNSADGRSWARMRATMARKASDDTARRVARAHRARVESGRPNWTRRPFGNERDGSVNAAEATAIREAAERILQGASLYEITKSWKLDGIRSTSGATMTGVVVSDLLRSPRLAGFHGPDPF